jgi:hypothetical protein
LFFRQNRFKDLRSLSIVFLHITEFENFLLVYSGVKKCKDMAPVALEKLGLILYFLEFKVNDYYMEHLMPETLES